MKIALFGLVGLGILLAALEGLLRRQYGLGNPPLYIADVRTGYRLAPNQKLRRRGNLIEINQFSMRGTVIQPQRQPDGLRILVLGDSNVNGGWWTDQAHTLTQRIQQTLLAQTAPTYAGVEVLNASANSWGPRNELGYVLRFGTFEAQILLLVLNTDDLFAVAPHALELGRSRSYPVRRPPLALMEALGRLRPPRPIPELQALYDQPGDRVGANLEALRQLHHLCRQQSCQLLLAITPLQRELSGDGPRDYERLARNRLQQLMGQEKIPYLDFLPLFQAHGAFDGLYRDHIHLSDQGSQLVAHHLSQLIIRALTMVGQESSLPLLEDSLQDPWGSA